MLVGAPFQLAQEQAQDDDAPDMMDSIVPPVYSEYAVLDVVAVLLLKDEDKILDVKELQDDVDG